MKKIDFVIAGQPKSGTTALAHFLSEHPDICMSYPKEPVYFATDFIQESDRFHGSKKYFKTRTLKEYSKHFKHARNKQLLGEASTCYAYSTVAAKNIYKHNPNAKIIIMLRHPVDFMHSLHMQYVNETVEDEPDFRTALSLEKERKNGKKLPPRARCPSYHFYKERTKYAEQVRRYLAIFGKENVMIIANEEFQKDNEKIYRNVLQLLGASNKVLPEFKIIHGSKKPRSTLMNKLLHTMWLKNLLYKVMGPNIYTKIHQRVNKLLLKPQSRENIDPILKESLKKETANEVRKLDKLTGRNFKAIWKY